MQRIISIFGLGLLLFVAGPACKKDKADEGDRKTAITTVDLEWDDPVTPILGANFTFKIKFNSVGQGDEEVIEFGIIYKTHIQALSDKTPVFGAGSTFIVGVSAPAQGSTAMKSVDFTFVEFNDVNYRAYAKLYDGTIVYGDVLYWGIA